MSRRRRAEKREIVPDPRYQSRTLARFINKVMLEGKKSVAQKIVYESLERFSERVKAEDPVVAFETALENAKPSVEVKSRRIGGATYQVPVEIPAKRRESLAMQWIIKHSRGKPGSSMIDALTAELTACFENEGSTIKKKDDTHRMAEANRAFAQYNRF